MAVGPPARRRRIYPEGSGIKLKAGHRLVMQVHYNVLNGSFPDRTTMDVTLATSVKREAVIASVRSDKLVLPPGMKDVVATGSYTNPAPVNVLIHGNFPHMHQLGTKLNVTVGGRCVIDVPKWDFNWQQFYMYEKPLLVKPGEKVELACHYNTVGQTKTVYWGDGTQDEMCLNFFYVTTPF